MRLFGFIACCAVVVGAVSPPALAADACSLLSSASASVILAQPVAQVSPAGPSRDEDSGGQLSYCTYRAAKSAVIVSVVEFPSSNEARKQLTNDLVRERLDAQDAKVAEDGGIAEKCFYGVSAKGAMYVFLKKNKVVGVGIGGNGLPSSATIKESLRKAALEAASKI